MERILPTEALADLDDYLGQGGGEGLSRARELSSEGIIEEVRRAGLRGRGGAGFPTGLKWRGLAAESGPRAVVANAAEGEPGTFKDRAIMGHNPYAVLEGLAVAAVAVGATSAYVGIKVKFETQIARLEQAAFEMSAAGWLEGIDLRLVTGPDDYLLGVESAMLEVIEGKDPLPRLVPPYIQGLTTPDGVPVATVVNNVETLANVPGIVANGWEWYRSVGTDQSPGTMVCSISGDLGPPTVAELALGTPLSFLVHGVGAALPAGRRPRLAVSGASHAPLPSDLFETPISFEGMEAAGTGLGSAGFLVFDDSTCPVEVAAVLSAFLYRGSCGQCPPCKLGTKVFADGFTKIMEGQSSLEEVEEMTAWLSRVTDANRCGLGAGQQALAAGILTRFAGDLVACLEGKCGGHRGLRLPTDEDGVTIWSTEG
jgi:NADH-quinone oxidoreductase subunit F